MTLQHAEVTTLLAGVSDDELRSVLEEAHLVTLLPTLASLTGDLSILRQNLRPKPVSIYEGIAGQSGLSTDEQSEARELAFQTLASIRDNGLDGTVRLSSEQLRQMLEFMTGPIDEAYVPMLIHELGMPVDTGAPSWTKAAIAPDTAFDVVIIGAGMSGLAAGHRLDQAGVAFSIIERRSDVGGVWLDNSYPGARLDTTNFNYSYSFAQTGSWPSQYSRRDEILDYFRGVADELSLREHIRFSSEFVHGAYDEASATWTVTIRNENGSEETLHANAIISAVGQLNEPNIPYISGAETFRGPTWHTARWNHDVDLADKRVVIIGTGASAFQVFPQVAKIAKHVTVLQRTPPYVVPTPGYTSEMPNAMKWLFQNVPNYHRWYRFSQFWANVDGIRDLAIVDPEWHHPISVSEKNEDVRQYLIAYLTDAFAERPDLLAQVIPNYPPYAKRSVRDDGTWTSALKQDNVNLNSEGIARITPEGVETKDGTIHEADVIIYGTGFKAADFLRTFELSGIDGVSLHDEWDGDARAYWGITVPKFPNLFLLYGPNTNLNTHGSSVLFTEAGVEYTLECIRMLLSRGARALNVKAEPFVEFNDLVDATTMTMAIGVSNVNTWYRNSKGRISQNWPLTTLDYWQGTREPRVEHYEFL
ncbi:NAD(P)/FAD-dependent oxidoreductase [Arthrobacter sp. NPDC080073]|uniref:flavin-containing monooxygenase n=1 Tax=Arthrobacter sp. NPDC080073 TaxID=3155919 RepID=UPI0034411577